MYRDFVNQETAPRQNGLELRVVLTELGENHRQGAA